MFWIRIYELIIDETLVKFIKQGTQQREKEGPKMKYSSLNQKHENQ
jgi:hypothetical protein